MNRLTSIRRASTHLLLALWWGGFTFYTTVVVSVGTEVLHSATKQGFITQQVTHYLNAIAGLTLAVVLWELRSQRKAGQARRLVETAWLVAVLALSGQVWVHLQMTALLDLPHRVVLEDVRFYQWHRLYLGLATAQWLGSSLLLLSWQPVSPHLDGSERAGCQDGGERREHSDKTPP